MVRTMRFSLGLPTDRVAEGAEFVSAAAVGEVAAAAEAAGFGACFVTEHPFPPEKWLSHGGHHALDPFVALSFAAAATRTLRLQTSMVVAGYRNPFMLAKSAASLDALSGGRMILGLAAGYLEKEFDAVGADFAGRSGAVDATIAALRAAWTGSEVTWDGDGFRAAGNVMLPTPAQPGGPPIWVGGNSRAAIRRAAESADGWVPFPTPPGVARTARTAAIESTADLAARIAYAREHAAAVGRDRDLDICFVSRRLNMIGGNGHDPSGVVDEADELSALGVTWLHVTLPADSRYALLGAIEAFGAEVISRAPRC